MSVPGATLLSKYAGSWRFIAGTESLSGLLAGILPAEHGLYRAEFKHYTIDLPPKYDPIIFQRSQEIEDWLEWVTRTDFFENPEIQAVNTDPWNIMDDIMPYPTKECCESECSAPTLLDTLTAKEKSLTQNLAKVQSAIAALQRNPELQQTLDLLKQVARF